MMTRSQLYMFGYAITSTALFAASLITLCTKAYDFMTLIQELTYDVRLVILLNFIVCFYYMWMFATIRIFFGEIRVIEMEHIADRIPFSMLTLLFLLLDDENLILDWIWFGLTLCMKVYHTILYDRIDFLQVRIVNWLSETVGGSRSRWAVFGMYCGDTSVILLLTLMVVDAAMAKLLAYDVFQGLSAIESLLFGIQFGVMGIESYTYLGKLLLNMYEVIFYRTKIELSQQALETVLENEVNNGENETEVEEAALREPQSDINAVSHELSTSGVDRRLLDTVYDVEDDLDDDDDEFEEQVWENKAYYVQTFTIFSHTLKALFYMVFLYMLLFHLNLALPGTIIQGCITSVYQLCKQVILFRLFLLRSRRLDQSLETATQLELLAADHMCIICREDMYCPMVYQRTRRKPLNPRKYPKKLRCGHILHLACLKDWLERSDSCPLCRQKVFANPTPNRPNVEQAAPAPAAAPNAQAVQTPAPAPAPVLVPVSAVPSGASVGAYSSAGTTTEVSIDSTLDATASTSASSSYRATQSPTSAGTLASVRDGPSTGSMLSISRTSSPSRIHIPPDWLALSIESSSANLYAVRLCDHCVGTVLVNTRRIK